MLRKLRRVIVSEGYMISTFPKSGFAFLKVRDGRELGSYNFELAPFASGSSLLDTGETSVLISMVQGPSCVSSTLNVCLARAGMRTG
jgi:hypothetical protein